MNYKKVCDINDATKLYTMCDGRHQTVVKNYQCQGISIIHVI